MWGMLKKRRFAIYYDERDVSAREYNYIHVGLTTNDEAQEMINNYGGWVVIRNLTFNQARFLEKYLAKPEFLVDPEEREKYERIISDPLILHWC